MSILPLENQNNTQPQNKLFDKLLGGTLGAIYGAKSGNFLDAGWLYAYRLDERG